MTDIAWELLVILLLVALNGFLAMSELAVVSSRRARLQQWAQKGRCGALDVPPARQPAE
ncbi:CNNM domain-containing protein [Defluviicoccus vanus]|uniref:CNNM domain-containing protein n=1 Tax=Defluviicoccus vanus TaxID=111831 RepID=UPI002953E4B7|nr:CNNM domain-containing protein [Defluviicoccus vanus]